MSVSEGEQVEQTASDRKREGGREREREKEKKRERERKAKREKKSDGWNKQMNGSNSSHLKKQEKEMTHKT